MNPINFIPIILATLSLSFASFIKNKNWAIISFIVWLVIFVLTFLVFK
ncbi:hypothetical protein J4403_03880 [Candidatus Woesearchaeota archaeon]|nr:hypothetical protein [Candidatus Woesearchaeota archaeon]